MHNLKAKLNNAVYFTKTLKGIGVSNIRNEQVKSCRTIHLKEISETHYLNFEEYRQDRGIQYSSAYVKENFNKIQRILGEPDKVSKVIFLSVKLKGKNADYIGACNACNAFEMKIKRRFYGNKWFHMNTFIGAIEFDKEHMTYHFHSVVILKDIKRGNLNESESIIVSTLKSLEETNSQNAEMVKYRDFIFDMKTRELGETIHYLVKTSSSNHNPLLRVLLNRKEQEQLKRL